MDCRLAFRLPAAGVAAGGPELIGAFAAGLAAGLAAALTFATNFCMEILRQYQCCWCYAELRGLNLEFTVLWRSRVGSVWPANPQTT